MRFIRPVFWVIVYLCTTGFLGFCSPKAKLNADIVRGPAPLTVHFDAKQSTDLDKDIVSNQWDFDNNGTVDAEGVTAIHTYMTSGEYTATLTVRDKKGHSSKDSCIITVGPISLSIASPADNASITKPDIMVEGSFTNETGNQTGVKVNGISAIIYNNSWFIANHVPLEEGTSVITVEAKDTAGNTITKTLSVTTSIDQNSLRLNGDAYMGTTPMETMLRIDSSFRYSDQYISGSYSSGATVLNSEVASGVYKISMTGTGIYRFTANAKDSQGNLYTDTIAIVLFDKTTLDTMLRDKWDAMRQALVQNDIEKAVQDFSDTSKAAYRKAFTALTAAQRADLAQKLGNAQFIKINGDRAEYDIRALKDGEPRSYFLLFERDGDGLWKIRGF